LTEKTDQERDGVVPISVKPTQKHDRGQLVAIFFFGSLLFLLYQLYMVFSPFLSAIAWGAILVVIFYPVHSWIERQCGGRIALASACTTVLVILTVILPGILFIQTLAVQLLEIYRSASAPQSDWGMSMLASKFKDTPIAMIGERVKEAAEAYQINLSSAVLETAKALSGFLGQCAEPKRERSMTSSQTRDV